MLTQVIQGFYSKLATYSNTYGCYHLIAPQNAVLPYITFYLETDMPMGEFGNLEAIENITLGINCFSSTGQKAVGQLADSVLTVMDNATLAITGYTHMVCRREFIGNIMFDPDTKIYQIPLRYRVWESKG